MSGESSYLLQVNSELLLKITLSETLHKYPFFLSKYLNQLFVILLM